MRTDRAAFQALLLAVGTWNQVAFRARDKMNDERDYPRERDPAQHRHQLRVLRVAGFRILHDPDGREDPAAIWIMKKYKKQQAKPIPAMPVAAAAAAAASSALGE